MQLKYAKVKATKQQHWDQANDGIVDEFWTAMDCSLIVFRDVDVELYAPCLRRLTRLSRIGGIYTAAIVSHWPSFMRALAFVHFGS